MISIKESYPKFVVFLCMFLMLSSISNSQEIKSRGYTVLNNGDTLLGEFAYKLNDTRYHACYFKVDSESSYAEYKPEQIKSYHIYNGGLYISEIDAHDSTQMIFLEFLVNGIADLYLYREGGADYYYIKKDGTLYTLSPEDNTKARSNSIEPYKGVLLYILQDCPDLSAQIKRTPYNSRHLRDLTVEYHNEVCASFECIVYARNLEPKYYLEPTVGLKNSWYGLSYSSNHAYQLSLTYGINIRIRPAYDTRFEYSAGLNINKVNYSGEFDTKIKDGVRTFLHRANYNVIGFPIIFEYNFPVERKLPFFSLEFHNYLLISPEYSVRYYTDYINSELSTPAIYTLYDFDIKKYHFGLSMGCGYRKNLLNGSYLQIKLNAIFQTPVTQSGDILDRQRAKHIQLSFAYGFSLNK